MEVREAQAGNLRRRLVACTAHCRGGARHRDSCSENAALCQITQGVYTAFTVNPRALPEPLTRHLPSKYMLPFTVTAPHRADPRAGMSGGIVNGRADLLCYL